MSTSTSPVGSAGPTGARWVRVALQVNPFAYVGKNAPSQNFLDEAAYNAALVAELTKLGVGLIAITDHWSAQTARGLIGACDAADIVALPGFEAISSEGIHLLVLFPRDTDLGAVDAAIGACGGTPQGSPGAPGRPLTDIVAEMTRRGALVIAAHANTESGLLGGQSGLSRAAMWRDEDLAAVAISPGVPVAPADQVVIDNLSPDYKRAHPLAVIHADDICHPARLSRDGATSWVKMSVSSLASLRVALRTPVTRIRRTDPTSVAHPSVKEISWQGGFLGNLRLPFSESLTTLIGGRGTGKSTVVESLRYVLDLPPIGVRAASDHAELVEKVLRPATKVSISIEVVHPTRAQYVVERTVPDPPVVRDAAGTVLARSPMDLLGGIEIFSQHELAELSDDKAYVAQMLGRFGGADPDVDRRAQVLDELRDNREAQLKRSGQIGDLDDELAELPKLHEQLAQFEAQGVDEGLRTQKQLQREERLYSTAAVRLEGIRSALETLVADAYLDISFADAEATDGLPNAANLNQIAPILETLATALGTGVDSLRNAVVTAAQQLELSKQTWTNQTESVREQYQTIVRALQDAGLDASKYLLLGGRIEALEASASTRVTLVGQLSKLRTERLQFLANHGDLEQAARQRLGEAATEANAHVKGLVFVKPVRSSDRGAIEALITRAVAGQRTQIMTALHQEDFSPRAFVAACRDGAPSLEARYSIKGAQSQALLSAGESLWLEIEEQQIGLAAEAELNVGTDTKPVYKNLSNLSKGQKATALLLLLLTDTTSPLIIDQPEDNLDNQFVYKGIVPRLRDLKGTRQVILSTHNANLPVLGDAELVIALNAQDGHGVVAPGGIGSIDDASVRGLAGDLLEGGREAFDARRHLYGY